MPLPLKFSVISRVNVAKLTTQTAAASQKRIMAAGLAVERTAKQLVSTGAGKKAEGGRDSGGRFTKGSVIWEPSKPGQPPRTRLGDLRNSIKTEVYGALTVIVGRVACTFYPQLAQKSIPRSHNQNRPRQVGAAGRGRTARLFQAVTMPNWGTLNNENTGARHSERSRGISSTVKEILRFTQNDGGVRRYFRSRRCTKPILSEFFH